MLLFVVNSLFDIDEKNPLLFLDGLFILLIMDELVIFLVKSFIFFSGYIWLETNFFFTHFTPI